jgi:hypothetical protein
MQLNETLIGKLDLDPAATCSCTTPVQPFSVTDTGLLQSVWLSREMNEFRLQKIASGGTSDTGLSWVRVTIVGDSSSETVCLFDYDGGNCDVYNLCDADMVWDPFTVEVPVMDPLADPVLWSVTPYSNSTLPETIDISALSDGLARVCISDIAAGQDCLDFEKQGESSLVINFQPTDDDGDGFHMCNGECDDTDPNRYPDAPEVNDGLDNQCPGDHGYGVVDEISGSCGFFNPGDKNEFSWPAQEGATSYEVVRSSLPDLSGDCAAVTRTETYWSDAEDPAQNVCYHYLVRALTPHLGSWGQDSAGVERTNICP